MHQHLGTLFVFLISTGITSAFCAAAIATEVLVDQIELGKEPKARIYTTAQIPVAVQTSSTTKSPPNLADSNQSKQSNLQVKNTTNPLAQVTSVSQLSDVQPT